MNPLVTVTNTKEDPHSDEGRRWGEYATEHRLRLKKRCLGLPCKNTHAVILDNFTCLRFEGDEALKDALVVVYAIADQAVRRRSQEELVPHSRTTLRGRIYAPIARYTILSDRRSYRPTEAIVSVEFSHRRFGSRHLTDRSPASMLKMGVFSVDVVYASCWSWRHGSW